MSNIEPLTSVINLLAMDSDVEFIVVASDEDCIDADAKAPLANKEPDDTALLANKEPD